MCTIFGMLTHTSICTFAAWIYKYEYIRICINTLAHTSLPLLHMRGIQSQNDHTWEGPFSYCWHCRCWCWRSLYICGWCCRLRCVCRLRRGLALFLRMSFYRYGYTCIMNIPMLHRDAYLCTEMYACIPTYMYCYCKAAANVRLLEGRR